MSFTSSRGWHAVICQFWPDDRAYGDRRSPGEISVVRRLAPWEPWPDQAWFDAIEAQFARNGGVAHARVVSQFWFAYPLLSEAQMRAAAGLP